MKNPRPPSLVVRGLYKLIGLLAAVTLQQIHRIHGYCVASNVVLVHGCLLNILFRLSAGPPLYTGNDIPVITQYVVVTACRFVTVSGNTDSAGQLDYGPEERRSGSGGGARTRDLTIMSRAL